MGSIFPLLLAGTLQASVSAEEIRATIQLSPGDVLTVHSLVQPKISFQGVVNRAGFLRTPGGSQVKAIGNAEDVASDLASMLERERGSVVKPVRWKVSRRQSFRVEGAVRWGGSIRIGSPLPISEVLLAVLPDGFADVSSASLVRGGVSAPLDSAGGKVRTGDRIVVPTRDEGTNVAVVGAVVKPSSIALESGLSIQSCLDKVGGIALHGSLDQIEILIKGSVTEIVRADQYAKRIVRRGESLRVPRAENVFSVTVASFAGVSQVVEVRDGTKLSEVLKVSGVKPALGDGSVSIRRMNRNMPAYRGRFSEILSNPLSDVFLSKGDAILVE